ncbi:MAG TPA: hypothetical protein VGS09_10560 [Actinomycetota bacterium]|jgi:hypothetical protein|nr:hypothetical protein [Actinomycetota bacterium]
MSDQCAKCNTKLDDWTGKPAERPPCPNCGATARIVELEVQSGVHVIDSDVVRLSEDAVVQPPTIDNEGRVFDPTIRRGYQALSEAVAGLHADHARLFLLTDLGGGTFRAQVLDEEGQVLGDGLGKR